MVVGGGGGTRYHLLALGRATQCLGGRSGCVVLARASPSNSALKSTCTLCCKLGRVNGATYILYSSIVPGGFSFFIHPAGRMGHRATAIITISVTSGGLLNTLRRRFNSVVSLGVSRRVAGARCTGGLCLSTGTSTATRDVFRLLDLVHIGVGSVATHTVCTNVTASANYFGCSGIATGARVVTTVLCSCGVGATRVGHLVFSAGSGGLLSLRHHILRAVRCRFGSGYMVLDIAGRVRGTANYCNTRLRNVTLVSHDIRNVSVNIAMGRVRRSTFGISVHAFRGVGTTRVTGRLNNNNRGTTTTTIVGKGLRRIGTRVLTTISGCVISWCTKTCYGERTGQRGLIFNNFWGWTNNGQGGN